MASSNFPSSQRSSNDSTTVTPAQGFPKDNAFLPWIDIAKSSELIAFSRHNAHLVFARWMLGVHLACRWPRSPIFLRSTDPHALRPRNGPEGHRPLHQDMATDKRPPSKYDRLSAMRTHHH